MVPRTRGYYDNPVTLICGVDSLVPFELRWFKDDKPLGNTLYYRLLGASGRLYVLRNRR